jgi:hypothetical protein
MPIPRVRITRDGNVAVTDAFILSFYVDETHTALVRRAEEVLGRYAEAVGVAALPFRLDAEGYPEPNRARDVQGFRDEVFHEGPGAGRPVQVVMGAADDETGYGFRYVADDLPFEGHPDLRNLVSLWLPTSVCLHWGWDAVYTFSCEVASLLPFSFGYGSPCLAYGDRIRPALGPAKRHPGFDVAFGEACRVDIGEKALGAYWLTFTGEVLSRALGGREALAGRLGLPITVAEVAGERLAIRLGPEPEVGDVNRGVEMPLYRRLAEVLGPQVRVPRSVYFPDENGPADAEAQAEWHNRFLASDDDV